MNDHFYPVRNNRAAVILTAVLAAFFIFFAALAAGSGSVYAEGKEKGMVGFTVYHQDVYGKELADPQIFYGKVGDKPLISSVRIKGYVPQVRQITRTISENNEENVFTFVYETEGAAGADKSGDQVLDIDETKTPLADPGKPQAGMRDSGNGITLILAVTCIAALGLFAFWRRMKKREKM